jgi:phosphoribosyl 1,2-cyclic phosphodiesterase
MMISHTHWDHIQGLPFFAPFFVDGSEWDIFAPRGLHQSLQTTLSGQMQYEYFPITMDALAADIRYHELVEGQFEIGDAVVTTQYLNHPALTLGFRVEADGASLVYACDHESASRQADPGADDLRGLEEDHVAFLRDADFVIHDAQYTAAEYPQRIGWGHSTVDYAAAVCTAANATQLAISHHDPARSDSAITAMVTDLRAKLQAGGSALDVEAAKEGHTIEISSNRPKNQTTEVSLLAAADRPLDAVIAHTLVLGDLRPDVEQVIRRAATALDLPAIALDASGGFGGEGGPSPSLLILDHDAVPDQVAALRDLAAGADGRDRASFLIIADTEPDPGLGTERAGDWMIWPFSTEYARSRILATILKETCRWKPAPRPHDELQRLAKLRSLNILDTDPEDRFDRITRIACNAFDVPIALISLVDEQRQWFKSCVGLTASETPREVSFCAHAIHEDRPLFVDDTQLDDRFADNPLVVGEPHVRFYAGHPLRTGAGSAIGTLCIIDSRPHQMTDQKAEMLADLAELVMSELSQ